MTPTAVTVARSISERARTCPTDVPSSLEDSLAEGNQTTFSRGEQFHVPLCIVDREHDVWGHSHSENGTETYRGGEPCAFG